MWRVTFYSLACSMIHLRELELSNADNLLSRLARKLALCCYVKGTNRCLDQRNKLPGVTKGSFALAEGLNSPREKHFSEMEDLHVTS